MVLMLKYSYNLLEIVRIGRWMSSKCLLIHIGHESYNIKNPIASLPEE